MDYSERELLSILQGLYKKLGRIPKQEDIRFNQNLPPLNQFYLAFGSWNNALKAANLKLNSVNKYTDEELLFFLRQLHKKLGRIPKAKDLGQENNTPAYITYNKHFGLFHNALLAIGIKINNTRYTKKELLMFLKKFYYKYNKTPKMKDFDGLDDYPCAETYKRLFKTWNNALREAGLSVNSVNKIWTKKQLIYQLKKKARLLGRTPGIRDMDKDSNCPGKNTYRKYFGNWTKAIRAANLQVKRFYSKKDLIRILRKLALKLGRTPSKTEMNQTKGYPSEMVFVEKFGCWNNAMRAARLEVNKGFNSTKWENWENLCIRMAKALYKTIEIRKYHEDGGLRYYPDIYVPHKNKFIDAKMQGYKKFGKQVKRYTQKCFLEFWCISRGVEFRSEKVRYVYSEELIRMMRSIKRYDLVDECRNFLVSDLDQKPLI